VDPAADKLLAFKLFVSVFQKQTVFVRVLLSSLDFWRVLKSSSLEILQLTSSSLPSVLSF